MYSTRSTAYPHTSYDDTYIDPRHMPSYRGWIPGLNEDYGQTFGAFTNKQFQSYRSSVLQSSRSPYQTGGQFPTLHSHNPDLVHSHRASSVERTLSTPRYGRIISDTTRSKEIDRFDELCQLHREHYLDRTGTLYPVPYFQVPESNLAVLNKRYK